MRTKEKDKLEKRQKVIEHLEKDVEELRRLSGDGEADSELERIRQQVAELRREFYIHLGPWQRAQIARHQQRPYTLDYVNYLFTDFVELHGDRGFADDKAIVAGLAKYHGRPVAVVGHQKGRDTKQRLARNFGQPKPEGSESRSARRQGRSSRGRFSASSTHKARTRGSMRKNAGRAKRSPGICAKWRGCPCRSS